MSSEQHRPTVRFIDTGRHKTVRESRRPLAVGRSRCVVGWSRCVVGWSPDQPTLPTEGLPPARRRAFSLVELLVVMVIIAMLAGLVVFRTRSYLIASKQKAAQAEIARLVQALETFYASYDRYPTNDEGLAILAEPSDEYPDGIINKIPIDPWKHPYQYNNPGRNGPYEIICLGADGQEGGERGDRDISSDDATIGNTDDP